MLETKCQKLLDELNGKTVMVEEIKTKSEMFDAVKLKASNYEEEARKCQSELELVKRSLDIAREEKETLNLELTNLKQQVELLKNDKMYLTKEIENNSNKSSKNEDDILRLENKLKEMRKEKKTLYDKLLSTREESKTEYERSLQEEIQKLKEKTQKDLDIIKQNSQENYERENRMLKESKDGAEAQVEKLKRQVEDLKETNTNVMMEFRTLQSTLEKQISEIRTQANLKIFDNERLQVSLMEHAENLKQSKIESEIMKKKLDVLKTEYYSLQNSTGKKITELETTLSAVTKELNQYRDLERDLDKVIETYSPDYQEKDGHERILSELTALVPTNMGRRVKYSLYLARKVSDLEKQLTEKREKEKKDQSTISMLTERLNKMKKQFETSSKPYNYLVTSLEDKDREVELMRKEFKVIEKDLKHFKKENDKLKRTNIKLEQDLEKLLEQKSVTSKLRDLLVNMKQDQENFNPSAAVVSKFIRNGITERD
ncbi:hypothetical protein NAEGRDRAFT_73664 [Naegleria gruberi]|uniref:Uncharacterized protein FM154 n=1 Tax=Naegleria gruberi TaxID=5762 RepID=D2VX94_NAEGR|nr:uncharacterized protein NAEGRDRAFT_73664 [Naegleria gruberi]EFC38637.1 hypothetical protein NAEGRDRAFT_73664 [Naegleria gruberi]|eukprot:XP_002671381.1 hypothetical protein NAEGRDRAFT_73664 [Naegleria gruberi strain NEG-M]